MSLTKNRQINNMFITVGDEPREKIVNRRLTVSERLIPMHLGRTGRLHCQRLLFAGARLHDLQPR